MTSLKRTLSVALLATAGASLLWSCGSEYRKMAGKVTHNQYDLWVMSGLDSIANASNMKLCDTVELYMAKGESEHFQATVSTSSKFKVRRVEEKRSNLGMTIREVKRWNGADDVLALAGDSVGGQGDLRLWFTYTTPQNAAPGLYNEVIELAGPAHSRYVQVRVHVYDCAVPEISTIPSVFGIDPTHLGLKEDASYEEVSAEKKRWSDLLLNYRIAPYFSTWIDGTMKVENSSSPWAWDDPRTLDYLSDPRFTRFAAPCYSLDDDELKAFNDTLRRRGLLDKAYYYVWDEPKNMAEYAYVKSEAERIHAGAPDAKIITTYFCGPQDGPRKGDLLAVWDILRGYTSIFCTGVWSLGLSEQRADSCRKASQDGEEWWSYVCMSDSPGLSIKNNTNRIRTRATLWRSYKEQPTGFLYWVVNSYTSVDPLTARESLPYGDGILVYPGKEFGSGDSLLVSARLECWKDGAEDYELLKLLEQQQGREAAVELLGKVYYGPAEQCTEPVSVNEFKKEVLERLTAGKK